MPTKSTGVPSTVAYELNAMRKPSVVSPGPKHTGGSAGKTSGPLARPNWPSCAGSKTCARAVVAAPASATKAQTPTRRHMVVKRIDNLCKRVSSTRVRTHKLVACLVFMLAPGGRESRHNPTPHPQSRAAWLELRSCVGSRPPRSAAQRTVTPQRTRPSTVTSACPAQPPRSTRAPRAALATGDPPRLATLPKRAQCRVRGRPAVRWPRLTRVWRAPGGALRNGWPARCAPPSPRAAS